MTHCLKFLRKPWNTFSSRRRLTPRALQCVFVLNILLATFPPVVRTKALKNVDENGDFPKRLKKWIVFKTQHVNFNENILLGFGWEEYRCFSKLSICLAGVWNSIFLLIKQLLFQSHRIFDSFLGNQFCSQWRHSQSRGVWHMKRGLEMNETPRVLAGFWVTEIIVLFH